MAYAALVPIGLVLLFITGCQLLAPPLELQDPPSGAEESELTRSPKEIVVFFDGTANDPASQTNVWKLFNFVRESGQATTFYVEGVGAKQKVIGMASAWGIDTRVRAAYSFLLGRYRPGDKVYLFGFSRGAYSARILASMLYHAGLPSLSGRKELVEPEELSIIVYDAFKCSTWSSYGDCAAIKSAERTEMIRDALLVHGFEEAKPVPIQFLGLWDTVEALGWPDLDENIDVPNPRYGDQLCNVRSAAHALSLDDNRARIFTPILLTRRHLLTDCSRSPDKQQLAKNWMKILNEKVEEVYFAGAHSDVGGGYSDAIDKLSGVSLSWMMDMAVRAGLPIDHTDLANQKYKQDPTACTHDAEVDFPYNLLYKRRYRNVFRYANDKVKENKETKEISSSPKVKFHACLIKHIEVRPRGGAEYAGSDPLAQDVLQQTLTWTNFDNCFESANGKYKWRGRESCTIEVVGSCQVIKSDLEDCTATP